MRIQLARPDNTFLNPDLYNQVFTMHGTTMMFLFAVPVVLAMGIYFVPLMVGARGIALAAPAGLRLLDVPVRRHLPLRDVPRATSAPTTAGSAIRRWPGPEFGYGKRADVWAQLITFTEVSALVVATCLICTILKLRTPGMSLNRMPLFVWAMLVVVVHGHLRDAGGHGLEHLPDPRSPGQHAFLQPGRRGRSAALAAPVLVLRPPRGLHHLPAGARHDVGDHRDLLAAAASSATS